MKKQSLHLCYLCLLWIAKRRNPFTVCSQAVKFKQGHISKKTDRDREPAPFLLCVQLPPHQQHRKYLAIAQGGETGVLLVSRYIWHSFRFQTIEMKGTILSVLRNFHQAFWK